MEKISQVLGEVLDWTGLANLLNIRTNDIEARCEGKGISLCYMREIVNRQCNRQESENPKNVAEDIAKALEKMEHKRQAQQLRELMFGKSVATRSSPLV